MGKSKCGWQNVNDNIVTRENEFAMFSYILSCKIRPREFIDWNFFYSGYEKSEIRKEDTKRLWSRNSSHSDSFLYHINGLRLFTCTSLQFPLPKTSIFKISETLLHHGSANHCTIVDEFAGHTELLQQKNVCNACVKISLSQVDCTSAMESGFQQRRFSDWISLCFKYLSWCIYFKRLNFDLQPLSI